MKQIVAYVKNHKLPAIALALQNIAGLTGMSFSAVHGFGRGRAKNVEEKVLRDLVDFVSMDRIEVFCSNEIADNVIETIINTAHEGLRGDGKIYVLPVEQAIRISSRERGEVAI